METTAEGIDRGEETAMMQELGCTQLHGFLFGIPDGAVSDASKLHKKEARAPGSVIAERMSSLVRQQRE